MKTSDSIASLAPALVKASADLKAVHKDRANSHFKNKYATLDAIVDAVRPVLAAHGLAVVQGATTPHTTEGGTLVAFAVATRLIHNSGEWIETHALMPLSKLDPQGAGAALTYGRRYGLSALLSLATDDDDDGEAAVGRDAPQRPATARTAPPAATRAPDAQRAPQRASGSGPVMPFGKTKGTPLADLPREQVESALAWATEKDKFSEFQAEARAFLAGGASAPPPPADDFAPIADDEDNSLPF
jgi:hypothetical protein